MSLAISPFSHILFFERIFPLFCFPPFSFILFLKEFFLYSLFPHFSLYSLVQHICLLYLNHKFIGWGKQQRTPKPWVNYQENTIRKVHSINKPTCSFTATKLILGHIINQRQSKIIYVFQNTWQFLETVVQFRVCLVGLPKVFLLKKTKSQPKRWDVYQLL
jgi:hypothetical protein